MTRKELCFVAEMNPATFNVHRNAGTVPFALGRHEAQDGAGRTWVRYTVHEAARLIAARRLAEAQGVTWSEGCAILRAESIGCGPIGPGSTAAEREGVHVARAIFTGATHPAATAARGAVVYEGPLDAIVRQAMTDAVIGGAALASLVSIDLSAAYATARERMALSGLASDGEGKPDCEASE